MASNAEKERWQKIFRDVNTNNDKYIDTEELKKFVVNLAGDISDDDVKKMFSDLDTNKNGEVTEDEFVTGMMKPNRRAAFEKKFADMDTDADGKLSYTELKSALAAQNLSEEEIESSIKQLDIDKDGFISLDEFLNLV